MTKGSVLSCLSGHFKFALPFHSGSVLRSINKYFSVRLDEEDNQLIHYMKIKANKG